jgi:hypothetical protein
MSTINYQIEDEYLQSLQEQAYPESCFWKDEITVDDPQEYQDALDRDTIDTIREFRRGDW